jgi:hypothetical protein
MYAPTVFKAFTNPPRLQTNTQILAISLLARSSFDDSARADGDVCVRIEGALNDLIIAFPNSEADERVRFPLFGVCTVC